MVVLVPEGRYLFKGNIEVPRAVIAFLI